MPPTTKERTRRGRQSAADRNFDADKFAAEREAETVKVDGVVYHRRLLNNLLSEQLQDLSLEQDRLIRRADAKIRQIAGERDKDGVLVVEPTVDPDDLDQIETIEDEIRDLNRQAVRKDYEMAALGLSDPDGNCPTVEILQEKVDRFALPRFFSKGGEPLEGPTPASESEG